MNVSHQGREIKMKVAGGIGDYIKRLLMFKVFVS